MSNKPIKTLSMSVKNADGSYLQFGNNSTWDNEKWRWSFNVAKLRELLTLLDSGSIEAKNGYVGGNCAVFGEKESIPQVAHKQQTLIDNNALNYMVDNESIPF